MNSNRRFPPPWSVEEQSACFVVRDHAGQKLAYVYLEDEPGRRLNRNSGRRVLPPSPPIPRVQRIGGTWLGHCLALCEPWMGGDPIAGIIFGSEFPDVVDVTIGPRYPHAPNWPFLYGRQNGETDPHAPTMRSSAGLTSFRLRLWITGDRRQSCSHRKRRDGLRRRSSSCRSY
jgi:hypothetical protein